VVDNLREASESALECTLEGSWALPAELTDPDGTTTIYQGQVMFSYMDIRPDTGEPVVIENPVVTLRLSSMERVPEHGEVWVVRIPNKPSLSAPLVTYVLDKSKAARKDGSLGIITLYLKRAKQK